MQTPAPAGRDGSESEAESMHTAQSHADSEARRDVSGSGGDADSTAKSDEYEVVEVDDGRADQSTPKPEQAARPKLPRLNSQSRSSSSFIGRETQAQDHAETSQSQPQQTSGRPAQSRENSKTEPSQQRASQGSSQNDARQSNTSQSNSHAQSSSQTNSEQGGPSRINTSHEIPIPIRQRKERSQSMTTDDDDDDDDDVSSVSSSSTESIGSRARYSDRPPQHTPTPVTRSSLKNKSDDEENPTIQIPKVTPLASGLTLPPNLAELAENLEDKYVDEFGNILEWDGRVLGRVEGDLPSMIGRPVSATGEIISQDGLVVGYVAENDTIAPRPPSPKPIQGMGEGMKVDHMGNILNKHNKIVGHFNAEELVDAPEPIRRARSGGGGGGGGCKCGHDRPRPTAAPSPSEIYLDVKSTNDGVQLIIKIPTVFNGGGTPNIHIGTSS
ncbi:hypothetical protein ACHAQH_009318 [Verticillium albo-atrum]